MLEIEVKAKLRNPKATRAKLLELGAEHVKTKVQVDTYYNHPLRDFVSTDEALRLREEDGRVILTYKGPKLDEITKTREEEKVEVSDMRAANAVLERLGFERVITLKKRRRHYVLQGMKIMLDEVEGLGDYIEVEKPGDEYEPRELLDFLRELGIAEEDAERRSYLELLLERRR
jgi:adenylate cyclase class 2